MRRGRSLRQAIPFYQPPACQFLEGLLHLNQYQENWTNYRTTAESLKHEKFLFLAKAGPYADAADPRATLAERVEALISQENSQ